MIYFNQNRTILKLDQTTVPFPDFCFPRFSYFNVQFTNVFFIYDAKIELQN